MGRPTNKAQAIQRAVDAAEKAHTQALLSVAVGTSLERSKTWADVSAAWSMLADQLPVEVPDDPIEETLPDDVEAVVTIDRECYQVMRSLSILAVQRLMTDRYGDTVTRGGVIYPRAEMNLAKHLDLGIIPHEGGYRLIIE